MTPQQIRQIVREEITNTLGRYDRIPLDVEKAFDRRLRSGNLIISSKGATTENQSVDEAGASTYSVLKAPDGFLEITINKTKYYLPYYG